MPKSGTNSSGFEAGARVGSQALDTFGTTPPSGTSKTTQTYSQVTNSPQTSSSKSAAIASDSFWARCKAIARSHVAGAKSPVPQHGSKRNTEALEMQKAGSDTFLEALEMTAGPEDGFVRMCARKGPIQ